MKKILSRYMCEIALVMGVILGLSVAHFLSGLFVEPHTETPQPEERSETIWGSSVIIDGETCFITTTMYASYQKNSYGRKLNITHGPRGAACPSGRFWIMNFTLEDRGD